MIRNLSVPESAFTFCNEHLPLSAVIVIHLHATLTLPTLAAALDNLQSRHSLLQASIRHRKGRYFFEKLPAPSPIPLSAAPRIHETSWETETEKALNSYFDPNGPLLRCVYVHNSSPASEILLILHHAIIDGISARLILSDFLKLLGGQKLAHLHHLNQSHGVPPEFRGLPGLKRKMAFMVRQFADEFAFALNGEKPAIPPHSENGVVCFTLDEDCSQKILKKAGEMGISINSLIGAAMLHALYPDTLNTKSSPRRAVFFADMRAKMDPPVPPLALGCYVSMARFSVNILPGDAVSVTAKKLWERIFAAGKKGEFILYAMMSLQVMKAMLTLKKLRMADTALSYIGQLDIHPQYGDIAVKDIKAFITNNRFGPKFTAFALCVFGCIGVDMNFLKAEFSHEEAQVLANRTRKLLEEFA
ncbi:MAG: condensation domain-containing protein [Bacteroidia bacterium]